MGVVFYLGIGIITHLIAWGGALFGMNSMALMVFWPIFILWWIILFIGFYIIPIVVIVVAASFIYDRIQHRKRMARMEEFRSRVRNQ